ncbi:MAG: glutathione S-transferase family protein [Myxococcota bacterium]
MGKLIDGVWTDQPFPTDSDGNFTRAPTTFRGRVEAGGRFAPEAGRYHLYVSLACPWAHRVLIHRKLRGLEDVISLSVVHYEMFDDGWEFKDGPGVISDPVYGARFMRDVYVAADPKFTGRVTVPVLWDKQEGTIVNNESRDLIRMLNTSFLELGNPTISFFRPEQAAAIDAAIDAIYEPINNGVYRSGFARSQRAYDSAVTELFEALDHWEKVLGEQRFLAGDKLTEADWCLFTTLVRFDPVYHGHFKCNLRRIADYPHLSNYLRQLYQVPGVAETVDFEHIKKHYYRSHESVNPTRIVPKGPIQDLQAPHNRGDWR